MKIEVKKFLGGKWFAPLIAEIGALEMNNPREFSDMGAALEDDAPDWSFDCLVKGATSLTATPIGLGPSQFGTTEFGQILGMKWSVIAGFAASHQVLKKLNLEQIGKIESVWGSGTVAKCIATAKEVSEKQLSELQKIKRRAQQLAEKQGPEEEKKFLKGLSDGVTYLQTVAEKSKAAAPTDKKAMDDQKRNLVHLFGAVCGPELEKIKDETSWAEIANAVSEMVDHKIEFDEDTLKKNLQRVGLNGVGKSGRPSGK